MLQNNPLSLTLKKFLGSIALMASLAWTPAHGEGHVEVVIRETTRPAGVAPVLVDVTFFNRGDEPVFLHKPSTPFGRTDDGLNGDHFLITDQSGDILPYTGSGPGYWGRVRLNHFVEVAPGESVHKEVNLSKGYDFHKGGDFRIQFHASLDAAAPEPEVSSPEELHAFVPNSQKFVQSNEITIHVDSNTANWLAPASPSGICSAQEMEKLYAMPAMSSTSTWTRHLTRTDAARL